MSGVKLVNMTDQDIILYEGTGGVYRSLKTIPKGKKHVLKVDPNETYREYRCRLRDEISRKSEAVVLTPFVFAEFTHVTIKWDEITDRLSYETKKKESGSNGATDMPSGQASPGLVQRLLSKFSWKREHAPSDVGAGGGDGDGDGDGEGGGSSDANVPRRGGALEMQQEPGLSSNV
jgi:hypothetical protein